MTNNTPRGYYLLIRQEIKKRLIHIGAFAAVTGSAYTLKFPLSSVGESGRRSGFYLALILAWGIVVWMLIFPHQTSTMLFLVLGYMIVITGGAGLYMIWKGIKAKENWAKIKCAGGGVGLVTCCFAADLMVLFGGVSILGEALMSFAPLILLVAVLAGRYLQKGQERIMAQPIKAV